VDYVKRNFLARGPYENFDQIKFKGRDWLVNIANQRLHSVTRKIPAEAFAQEEKHLLQPLPHKDYDYIIPHNLPVNHQCLVNFQTNKYSVPHKYARKMVTLKATTGEIIIYQTTNKSPLIAGVMINISLSNRKIITGDYSIIKKKRHHRLRLKSL
jgi:hypothetical protein